jgi:hypothetical protein
MREMDLHSLRMHLDTLYPTVANDLEDNNDDDYKSVQGGTLIGPDSSFDMFESWIMGGAEIYDLDPDILDSMDSEPLTSEFIEYADTDTDTDDDITPTVYSSEFIEGGAASDVDDALKTLGTLDTTPVVSGPQISLVVPIGSVTDTNMNNLKNENFKTNILNLLNNIIL